MWSLILTLGLQSAPGIEHELYRTQIAAAESAIRLSELAVARAWLDRTDPKMRGFEWRVHDAALDECLSSIPTGSAKVAALAASSDGATLAFGFSDGAVALHRASDGALIAALGSHKESVTYARFDADGSRLVTTSYDRTVKIWNVAERKLDVDFKGHGYPVGGADFSPDGVLAASCAYERPPERMVVGTVHLWNSKDGTLVRSLEGGRKPLVGLAFSPDGTRIAAGSWDFCVFVWDAAGGEPLKCAVPDEGIYNAVDDVAWTADGKFVIGASKDKTARVWNATSGELVATLRGHTDYVVKLALTRDGATLATASDDGTLRLWNTADWSPRATLIGHGDDLTSAAFAPDGSRLFSSSTDGSVRIWDARTEYYGGAKLTASAAAYVARYSPDGSRMAIASFDGRIEIRDGNTLEPLHTWQAHPKGKSCHALAWTPDGKALVSGSWEPVVRVFDAASGELRAGFEQGDGTSHLAISPDGKLVGAAAGKRVVLWSLEEKKQVGEFTGHTSTALAANFSPDSKLCVSTGRDGAARVFDVSSVAQRFEIRTSAQDVAEAMFTPDASSIVVATRGGHITLHAAADGSLLRELARLRHGLNHFVISPDSSRVAVASNVVVLIDLARGGVVGELRRHVEHPYNVAFDPSGTRLLSCSTDKTIAVSDTRPLREWLSSLQR